MNQFMNEKLNNIIKVINEHKEWSQNIKLRYAYIELGKLVHKNVEFFYSLYDKLSYLNLDMDDLEAVLNNDEFTNNVMCRDSAMMLKYIFDNTGINSQILQNYQVEKYINLNNKGIRHLLEVDDELYLEVLPRDMEFIKDLKILINGEYQDITFIEVDGKKRKVAKVPDTRIFALPHFFIAAEGDNGKNYFMTLNPDLASIQSQFSTKKFGTSIAYMLDGKPVYCGDKVDASIMDETEIREIDAYLGYLNSNFDGKLLYHNEFIDNYLRKAFLRDEHYLDLLARDEENVFYNLMINLLNDDKSDTECLSFNIKNKTHVDWTIIKKVVCYETINKITVDNKLDLEVDFVKLLLKKLDEEKYGECLELFNAKLEEFPNRIIEDGLFSYSSVFSNIKGFFGVIDKFQELDFKSKQEFKSLNIRFNNYLKKLSLYFVDRKYIPYGKVHMDKKEVVPSSEYVAHRLILSFNQIFDIGSKTPFNDLHIGEQTSIIEKILDIVFANLKVNMTHSDYDRNVSAVKNRIISSSMLDPVTKDYNFLFFIKNDAYDVPFNHITDNDDYGIAIVYDLKNNLLYGGRPRFKSRDDLYYCPTDDTLKILDNPNFMDKLIYSNPFDIGVLPIIVNNIVTSSKLTIQNEEIGQDADKDEFKKVL